MSYRLITASAHDTGLPDKSVHCIVTSPPYYGLRSYDGDQDVEWQPASYKVLAGLPAIDIPAMRCGLGAEPTPEAFIGHLMLVMREMWRVLRDDGVMFVNLGDSYAGSGKGRNADGAHQEGGKQGTNKGTIVGILHKAQADDLKPKDMMMIPALFALAARADGWYLRSNMPWIKRNGMPDSTADRPSTVIENIFMLAKSEKYFFDMEAVKQPIAEATIGRAQRQQALVERTGQGTLGKQIEDGIDNSHGYAGLASARNGKTGHSADGLRNFRSSDFFFRTWQGMLTNEAGPMAMVVNTKGYSAAHFATWPLDMVATMIKAGSSERGVCPACGAPWERVTERTAEQHNDREGVAQALRNQGATNGGTEKVTLGVTHLVKQVTTGWKPTCTCNASESIPATVLDPFNGSGTSGRAALQLNRSYIGIDICQSYQDNLAPARMGNVQIEMSLT